MNFNFSYALFFFGLGFVGRLTQVNSETQSFLSALIGFVYILSCLFFTAKYGLFYGALSFAEGFIGYAAGSLFK